MDLLPTDVLRLILLDSLADAPADRARCRRVCKRWKCILKKRSIYASEALIGKQLPSLPLDFSGASYDLRTDLFYHSDFESQCLFKLFNQANSVHIEVIARQSAAKSCTSSCLSRACYNAMHDGMVIVESRSASLFAQWRVVCVGEDRTLKQFVLPFSSQHRCRLFGERLCFYNEVVDCQDEDEKQRIMVYSVAHQKLVFSIFGKQPLEPLAMAGNYLLASTIAMDSSLYLYELVGTGPERRALQVRRIPLSNAFDLHHSSSLFCTTCHRFCVLVENSNYFYFDMQHQTLIRGPTKPNIPMIDLGAHFHQAVFDNVTTDGIHLIGLLTSHYTMDLSAVRMDTGKEFRHWKIHLPHDGLLLTCSWGPMGFAVHEDRLLIQSTMHNATYIYSAAEEKQEEEAK